MIHHDGSARYVSDQAPSLGDTVTVFLRASAGSVHLRSTPDGEPAFVAAVADRPGWWRASLVVGNPVTRYRWLVDGRTWFNALGAADHDVPDSYDFRLVAHEPPPAWSRDAIVYQIFPDRFARSRERPPPDWAVPCDWDTPVVGRGPSTPHQVYGGDLDGIAAHLDHVAGLGANTVYLTPIFPARSNHRYNASSFDTVDPLLGGDAALRRLSTAVHDRGMRLVGDLTTNHCGDDHPWFTSALAGGPEREMFYFGPDGRYESWLGVTSLPKLNWGSDLLRRRFVDGVATRWLDVLDGWRVDVANMTGRRGADDHAHAVARLLRAAVVGARPDAVLLAEHGHDATGDLDRDGWQGTMNYAGFTRPLWSWLAAEPLTDFLGVPGGIPQRGAGSAVATMRAFNGLVSWRAYTHSWTLLGSHDTARIRTVVGDAARHEVALGLLMTLPGVPMIFAGDEFGLTGDNGEASRTPMPWGRAVPPFHHDLVALRRGHEALRTGGLRWLHADGDALAFVRDTADGTLLVLARRAPGPPVALPLTGASNVYGGADGPTGDGPTFQVWRL